MNFIKRLTDGEHYNQSTLAKTIGCSRQLVSLWINGDVRINRQHTKLILQLAKQVGLKPTYEELLEIASA